tara:strand:+ start:409 stop:864 length:456 start_codon:yes stop_codon:yes gene_type:complete
MLQIEDFKKKIMNNSRLLGLDIGKKRIGVAICDNKRLIATPYKTIIKKNFDQFLSELKIIISENNISGIIVGNPINMDGSYGHSTQAVADIANLISKNISIPITLWDERLSSVAAYTLSGQLHIKAAKKNKKIDQNAATFILQGAIDFINN